MSMLGRPKDDHDFADQASQLLVGYSPESYQRLIQRIEELLEVERKYKLVKNADRIATAFEEAIGAYHEALLPLNMQET